MSSKKQVFTTGQVAKICQVAPRTVSKWFDSGKLRGYRIPGSQDRRIPREQLIRFLKENGMPLGGLEQEGWHKILIVGAETLFIDRLRELLPEDEDYKYEVAHSGFEAGTKASAFQPDSIIIDHAMGRSESLQIAQTLRRNDAYRETLIVALASEDEPNPEGLSEYGYSDSFKKPFDIALLAERIRTLVEEKRDAL
jgi:two-component system, OmpR family, response regulator RpaA